MRIILFSYDKCVGGIPESGRFHTLARPVFCVAIGQNLTKSYLDLHALSRSIAKRQNVYVLRLNLMHNGASVTPRPIYPPFTACAFPSFMHLFWQDCRKAKGKSKL